MWFLKKSFDSNVFESNADFKRLINEKEAKERHLYQKVEYRYFT